MPIIDIEKDEDYTLNDFVPGVHIFYAGRPHTITKVKPLPKLINTRITHEGLSFYDDSGWGHTIISVRCDKCGVLKCFSGMAHLQRAGWLILLHHIDRHFCSIKCLTKYASSMQ